MPFVSLLSKMPQCWPEVLLCCPWLACVLVSSSWLLGCRWGHWGGQWSAQLSALRDSFCFLHEAGASANVRFKAGWSELYVVKTTWSESLGGCLWGLPGTPVLPLWHLKTEPQTKASITLGRLCLGAHIFGLDFDLEILQTSSWLEECSCLFKQSL